MMLRKLNETKEQFEKRKLANMIAQGESGNIHSIIHSPEIRDEIDKINPKLFKLYDRLMKSNDDILFKIFQVDNIDDVDFKVLTNDLLNKYNNKLRGQKNGIPFSFDNVKKVVDIESENKEKILKLTLDIIKNYYGDITKNLNLIIDLIDFSSDSLKEHMYSDVRKYKTKDIVTGVNASISGYSFVVFDYDKINKEVQQDLYNEIKSGKQLDQLNSNKLEDYIKDGRFTVIARSCTLPTLLHEIILGIYEIIISPSIPSDVNIATDILTKTDTLKMEFMDYLYGRPFRDDLVNFIVSVSETVSNSDVVPNLKEFVFGAMMHLEDDAFLNLIKGMIDNTPSAKEKMSNIISDIVEKHMAWKNRKRNVRKSDIVKKDNIENVLDYSKMSQNQLQSMLNVALDNENYEEVNKIAEFIK
jgi:hypothetical protein